MTDPHDGLVSFQQALTAGLVDLHPTSKPDLFVHMDEPTPTTRRLSYARMDQQTVRALAIFIGVEPIDGIPTFQVGYAVPKRFRGQGLASSVLADGITELSLGLARNGIKTICVEAVISVDNAASLRVAEKAALQKREEKNDELSGQPAVQLVGKFSA